MLQGCRCSLTEHDMLVHHFFLNMGIFASEESQQYERYDTMLDMPSHEDTFAASRIAIDVGWHCRHSVLQFIDELVRQVLVGILFPHPFGVQGQVLQCPVELVGMCGKGMLHHVCSHAPGYRHRVVGGEAVDHKHLLRIALRIADATLYVELFVVGQDDG